MRYLVALALYFMAFAIFLVASVVHGADKPVYFKGQVWKGPGGTPTPTPTATGTPTNTPTSTPTACRRNEVGQCI